MSCVLLCELLEDWEYSCNDIIWISLLEFSLCSLLPWSIASDVLGESVKHRPKPKWWREHPKRDHESTSTCWAANLQVRSPENIELMFSLPLSLCMISIFSELDIYISIYIIYIYIDYLRYNLNPVRFCVQSKSTVQFPKQLAPSPKIVAVQLRTWKNPCQFKLCVLKCAWCKKRLPLGGGRFSNALSSHELRQVSHSALWERFRRKWYDSDLQANCCIVWAYSFSSVVSNGIANEDTEKKNRCNTCYGILALVTYPCDRWRREACWSHRLCVRKHR